MSGTTTPAGSFDVQGALAAGYAPADVVKFLSGLGDKAPIDVESARKAGYSDDEIVQAVKAHAAPSSQGATPSQSAPAAPGDTIAASKGRFDLLDANVGTPPGTIPPELGGVGATSGRGPIRDPARWQATREDVQRHVERLAALASTAGDHELAGRVLAIGAVPDANAKATMAATYLASLPPERAVLARQILADPTLLKGVSTTEGTP